MSMSLDDINTYAAGYEDHYVSAIEPELLAMDGRRQTAARTVIALGVALVIGILVAFNGTWLGSATGIGGTIFEIGGILVALGSGVAGFFTYKRVHGAFKQVLVGRTCDFLGLTFEEKDFSFPLHRFHDVQLVRDYDRSHLEDRITGRHEGVGFELCEAKLEDRRRSNDKDKSYEYVTIFDGLLFIFDFPKSFSGETLVTPDATWLGNMLVGSMKRGERVTLEDATFEDKFEVYSDDQVEARYLLTPRFMERLVALGEALDLDRPVSLAFSGDNLLIAARSSRGFFEGGHIFSSFAKRERAEKLIRELSIIYDIIEVLNLTDTTGA